jgi:hypothetical protein
MVIYLTPPGSTGSPESGTTGAGNLQGVAQWQKAM